MRWFRGLVVAGLLVASASAGIPSASANDGSPQNPPIEQPPSTSPTPSTTRLYFNSSFFVGLSDTKLNGHDATASYWLIGGLASGLRAPHVRTLGCADVRMGLTLSVAGRGFARKYVPLGFGVELEAGWPVSPWLRIGPRVEAVAFLTGHTFLVGARAHLFDVLFIGADEFRATDAVGTRDSVAIGGGFEGRAGGVAAVIGALVVLGAAVSQL